MKRAVIVSLGPTVVVSVGAPPVSRQRCPCMWKSWKLESIPKTWIATSWPTFAFSVGVLPANARPLMHWKARLEAR